MLSRMLVCCAAVVAALAAAGCGEGPEAAADAAPAAVTIEVTESGYAMPARIEGGVVAMRFRNAGSQPHEFAMGRIAEGRAAADAVAVAPGLAAGRVEAPSWLEDIGGPPLLTAGDEITITRTLAPGTYLVFDALPDTRGVQGVARGIVTTFEVAGDSGARPPVADAVITATRDRYEVPPLIAGTRTLELRNTSGAGRGFLLATLAPGADEADLAEWGEHIGTTGRLPATPVPARFLGAMQTIPTGTSVFLTLELEAGREYGLSDDESGMSARFTPR